MKPIQRDLLAYRKVAGGISNKKFLKTIKKMTPKEIVDFNAISMPKAYEASQRGSITQIIKHLQLCDFGNTFLGRIFLDSFAQLK